MTLRGAGLAEAGLGLAIIHRAPVSLHSLYRTVAPYFDRTAPIWRNWLFRDANAAFEKALIRYVQPGAAILDLGCGTGANLELLLRLELPFGSYAGVDSSEAMLNEARKKSDLPAVSWYNLDLETDRLPEDDFDLVISTWAFEHLKDVTEVVNKAWEGLKPGGRMLLLFETRSKSWQGSVADWAWGFFSTHLVREEEYRHFPGIISIEHFHLAGAPPVLITIRKPVKNGYG
ncbi:MAG: class I SAM-dependent methyltransferase [Thermoleophilia bacterium]|nr:class I SAM-dependent methyltransferase [Thermoleophilia bacterium]